MRTVLRSFSRTLHRFWEWALHQAGKIQDLQQKDKYLDWLFDLEYNLLKLPKPNKVVFLNVPVATSQKLRKAREEKEGFKSAFISLPLINSDNNKSFSLDFYIASSNRPYLNSIEISMCFDVPKDRVISSEELNELNADKFEYKYVQDFEIEDFSMTMYYHIVMNTKMAFFIIDDFAMEDFNHEQLTNLQNKYQD